MINMDTMKITATKVEITGRNKDDLPGYKNDHKHYNKSDGGFNQKMDQEDLKTYTAAFVIRGENVGFTIFNQTQFQELALGLELSNRPFLWVVRLGMTKETTAAYPDGYMERVRARGRIVSCAPQQKVLAHSSIACFVSHCGWNSTLEGVTNGLSFLCWPYFVDQFHNKTYICDIWKTGLGFNQDEAGIITREEVNSKIE
nr:UDP-glycosyltransferase 83A1-like [Tanacetum cinerariifolium]